MEQDAARGGRHSTTAESPGAILRENILIKSLLEVSSRATPPLSSSSVLPTSKP